ncbi:MAG: dephospho-CoA kinase [Pelolinea sp.]|nr:dephospho-CoA kinase [Pelolinea sp.]
MNDLTVHKDRFIIGLTGNIGTGKSLVRKMLQHLGAYGIDGDALAQEALKPDGPASEEIIRHFGKYVLNDSGELDRAKIAHVVFNDKNSLVDLEKILHPLVITAAENLISHARLPIIVIEAIKLLESDLAGLCDSIWVVDAREEIIFDRLASDRGMDRGQIIERLSNQSPSQDKQKKADVVIENNWDPLTTWQLVQKSWKNMERTNNAFSDFLDKTTDLITVFKEKIVLPDTNTFSEMGKYFSLEKGSSHPFVWLRNEDIHQYTVNLQDQQDLVRMALTLFIFFTPSAEESETIAVWDLSQFELTLTGYSLPIAPDLEFSFQSLMKDIEVFCHFHLVNHINILLNDLLKERTTTFRKLGYNLVTVGEATNPQWNKAGYNLYQKNISEKFDLFSGKKSG